MAYSFICIACMKVKGDKQNLSLQQILYGLKGGPFGGLLQGENLERDSLQKRNMHIMAERAMRRKRHRKRHNMYRTRCLNIQRHFSIITILFPALFISTVYVCHAITKSILDTIALNNFKYINVYTLILIHIIHAHLHYIVGCCLW